MPKKRPFFWLFSACFLIIFRFLIALTISILTVNLLALAFSFSDNLKNSLGLIILAGVLILFVIKKWPYSMPFGKDAYFSFATEGELSALQGSLDKDLYYQDLGDEKEPEEDGDPRPIGREDV